MIGIVLSLLLAQAPQAPTSPPPEAKPPAETQAQPAPAPGKPAQPAAPAPAAEKVPPPYTAPAPPVAQTAATAPATVGPVDELLQVKAVYVLQMSRAFDQYLATHLIRGGLLQVVTDPQKADAVITEQLGRVFEDQMEELYPKPKAPDPLPAAEEDPDAPSKPTSALMLEMKDPEGRPRSTFGRGRGTIFVVHRSTGNVVWSTYLRPKSPTADVLNDAAKQVADQLKDAIKKRQNALLKQASGDK